MSDQPIAKGITTGHHNRGDGNKPPCLKRDSKPHQRPSDQGLRLIPRGHSDGQNKYRPERILSIFKYRQLVHWFHHTTH
jgi:hypothetical protein